MELTKPNSFSVIYNKIRQTAISLALAPRRRPTAARPQAFVGAFELYPQFPPFRPFFEIGPCVESTTADADANAGPVAVETEPTAVAATRVGTSERVARGFVCSKPVVNT